MDQEFISLFSETDERFTNYRKICFYLVISFIITLISLIFQGFIFRMDFETNFALKLSLNILLSLFLTVIIMNFYKNTYCTTMEVSDKGIILYNRINLIIDKVSYNDLIEGSSYLGYDLKYMDNERLTIIRTKKLLKGLFFRSSYNNNNYYNVNHFPRPLLLSIANRWELERHFVLGVMKFRPDLSICPATLEHYGIRSNY